MKVGLGILLLVIGFGSKCWGYSCLIEIEKSLEARDNQSISRSEHQHLSRLILTDPVLRDQFVNSPELWRYIYFHHVLQNAPIELKDSSRRALQKSSGIRSFDELDTHLDFRLNNIGVRETFISEFEAMLFEPGKEPSGIRGLIRINHRFPSGRFSRATAQARSLPHTLSRIKSMVDAEMSPEKLDALFWEFWAFHQFPDDRTHHQRRWGKARPTTIQIEHVRNMSHEEYAGIAQFAAEVEAPISDYSRESGQSFRWILPNLARFMGKHREENEHKLECRSTWCAEEKRHVLGFAKIVEKLRGRKYDASNPNQAAMNTNPYEESAALHLAGRESTEWNASSVYFMLGAHSSGPLLRWLNQMLRDEIKHLTIMSAADRYLYGRTPNQRLIRMAKKVWHQAKHHSGARTDMSGTFKNPVTALEVVYSHFLVEAKMRRYLNTLPLEVLTKFFETATKKNFGEAVPVSEAERAEDQARLAEQDIKRWTLSRWPNSQKELAMAQRRFEQRFEEEIDQIVKEQFGEFNGAESYGSTESVALVDQINQLYAGRDVHSRMMRKVLNDRLRYYQILESQD